MKRYAVPVMSIFLLTLLGLAACERQAPGEPASPPAAETAVLSGVATTVPPEIGDASDASFWAVADAPGGALLLAAEGEGGLVLHDTAGNRLATADDVEAVLVETLDETFDGGGVAIVYDARAARLVPYRVSGSPPRLEAVPGEPVTVADELTGLCSYHSPLSGSWYVYGVTDEGLVLHWELYRNDAGLAGRLLRSIPTGKGSGYCTVDPNDGELYLADEELGIWHFGAEPEHDTTRAVLDLVEPWGGLGEEIKGIDIYAASAGDSYLLVADPGNGRIAAYTLPDGDYTGAVRVEGLEEAEGLAAVALTTGLGGWLAMADEGESDGATDFKVVAWDAVAGPLGLEARRAAGEAGPGSAAGQPVAVVRAEVETEPVASWGDAADDPAIWVHPDDPALSLVLGTQKQLGLHVYDLGGRELQFLADGRLNNVDLRDGFKLAGKTVPLVAASNRTHDSITLYAVDADARRLARVDDGVQATGLADPYGLCLYHGRGGEFYAFVNDSNDGLLRQFRLVESSPGRVSAEPVRDLAVGSQAEGCVADDEAGALFVGEEGHGLWKYGAEPDAGDARTLVDSVEGEHMVADVEGVSLWRGEAGGGYLVVSNQGADNYLLYRRDGDHEYVGTFHIVANPALGIDGASETDGLDVTSTPLGPRYPQGLLVVQDGRNIAPAERQNYKFVSWQAVMDAMDAAGD